MLHQLNALVYRTLGYIPRKVKAIHARDVSLRELLAARYLWGDGIEVGALDYPLPLPPFARVRYVDREPIEQLRKSYHYLAYIQPPDIVCDGETLPLIEDASQQFVIANHFLEHCQDPIGTLKHFLRVLKPEGVAFLALPDKRFTFDIDRPPTPLAHLLRDHEEGPAWSHRAHWEEVYRVVLDDDDVGRMEREMAEFGNTHYHVWSQTEMLEHFAALKPTLDFEIEAFVSNPERGEGIFILRKGDRGKNRAMGEASLRSSRELYKQRNEARA